MSVISSNQSVQSGNSSAISANRSVIAGGGTPPPFVYPSRIANYLFDGDVVNTLGADATNVGGTFPTDTTRGVCWDGDGAMDVINDVVHNGGGTYYSATIWWKKNDTTEEIIFGNSGSDDIFPTNTTTMRINFRTGGNDMADFAIPTYSTGAWNMTGVSLEQVGAVVHAQLFHNGVESTTGTVITTTTTISSYTKIGDIGGFSGLNWNGRFGICNIGSTLWTPADHAAIYNNEFIS